MNRTKTIDGELLRLKNEIVQYAESYGLDFHNVIFEVCDYDTINILAAQGGFPARYPHWRFGMDYDQLYKGYAYGLQKIYEMVVNTNPCYAYLLNVNNFVDQKIVMAHVYGHADFFKNNYWFSSSDTDMMDVMANHGTKIRRYSDKHGLERVEDFIDKVLSLETLVDTNVLFTLEKNRKKGCENIKDLDGRSNALRSFMNSKLQVANKRPDKKSECGKQCLSCDGHNGPKVTEQNIFPRDVMKYLLDNAPLEDWELDIIGILREEAYYFLPQRITKIMNEGWASYWHSRIMTQDALKASEIIDFADHHAGVMAMSRKQINPYKIGLELFRDIEFRWDTGRFGKEYQDCDDMVARANWDKKLGLGREKIFEVRRTHNDVTFIETFFTKEFCERQQIFTYKYNSATGRNEIDTRDFQEIKSKLLSQLTNFGTPVIQVEDGNYENRGEMLLRHVHQGSNLDLGFAADTMRNIYVLWKRPINLATKVDDKEVILVYDGKEMRPANGS